jgi:GNAT superfamily N-acetyltransferase
MKGGVARLIRRRTIVAATGADAGAVAQVYADSWPRSVEHATALDVRIEVLRMRGASFWEAEISRLQGRDGHFLVAKHGARVVGFAGSTSAPDGRWELLWLFVKPEVLGRGVGQQLHKATIVAHAGAWPTQGCLWAVPGNRRAERFYADRGWQPTTSTKDVTTPAGTFPLRKWVLSI